MYAQGTTEEACFGLVLTQTSNKNNSVFNFTSVQNEESGELTHKFVYCYY